MKTPTWERFAPFFHAFDKLVRKFPNHAPSPKMLRKEGGCRSRHLDGQQSKWRIHLLQIYGFKKHSDGHWRRAVDPQAS